MSKKVLFIGNETQKKQLILEKLKSADYEVYSEIEGRKAINFLYYYREYVDLVVFKTTSEAYSGLNMCREIRKLTEVPVIMITARDEEYDDLYSGNIENVEFMSRHTSVDIIIFRVNALLEQDNAAKL